MADKKSGPSGLHEGHRQRVWREFTKNGIDENTPPHKVLELIFFFTIPRRDTNGLAHIILQRFGGSFANVMEASVEQLMEASITDNKDIPRISEYTASHIKLMLEIVKYYYSSKAKQEKQLFNRVTAADYLFKKLMNERVEMAYLFCLDCADRFLACPKLSEGDEVSVGLSPRKVLETITKVGATKVILAHNHPRGVALPSPEDIKLTAQIAPAISGINVVFMDHIIVADNDYVSLRDSKDYGFLFSL